MNFVLHIEPRKCVSYQTNRFLINEFPWIVKHFNHLLCERCKCPHALVRRHNPLKIRNEKDTHIHKSFSVSNNTFKCRDLINVWCFYILPKLYWWPVITLSIRTGKAKQSISPDQTPQKRRLIRVYTLWHSSSSILDTFTGSKILRQVR